MAKNRTNIPDPHDPVTDRPAFKEWLPCIGIAGCFIGLLAISFYFLVMRRYLQGRI